MLSTSVLTRWRRGALALLAAGAVLAAGAGTAAAAISIPASGVTGLTSADLVAGRVNADYNVSFTTDNANAASSVTVTFPAGYVIGASATVQDLAGNNNRVTVNGVHNSAVAGVVTNPGARQIMVVLPAAVPLNGGLNGFHIITGVTNPAVAGTGAVNLTTNAAGETGAAAAVTITPGALTSASLVLQSGTANATGNVVVSFVTANPIPSNGRIQVAFPSGFVLNSGAATAVVSENLPGSLGVSSTSGTTVTLTRSGGGTLAAGSTVTFTLSNVRNPGANVTSGPFVITTQTDVANIDRVSLASAQVAGQNGQPGAGVQGQKVTICHKGKVTISIAASAVPAHAKMDGFRLGACN